ncbi:MAG: alpha/beta hydrolase [Ilumatobacteraceae bacterium]
MTVTMLRHNKIDLALHTLREGDGTPLLLLHGLGESSPVEPPRWAVPWRGPVMALDFTGHGRSTVPVSGGYTAEILLADADVALAELGTATVVGRGLGAYVALMLAGSRPRQVRGSVLCDGPGLAGGAVGPISEIFVSLARSTHPPDPYALFELSRDPRPPDYSTLFVRMAVESSGIDEPVSVAAVVRPPWLAAVVDEIGVTTCSVVEALAVYASSTV